VARQFGSKAMLIYSRSIRSIQARIASGLVLSPNNHKPNVTWGLHILPIVIGKFMGGRAAFLLREKPAETGVLLTSLAPRCPRRFIGLSEAIERRKLCSESETT